MVLGQSDWAGCNDPAIDCSNVGSCQIGFPNATCVCSPGYATVDLTKTPQCTYTRINQALTFLYVSIVALLCVRRDS